MSDAEKLDELMQFVAHVSNQDERMVQDENHQPIYVTGYNNAVWQLGQQAMDLMQRLERG